IGRVPWITADGLRDPDGSWQGGGRPSYRAYSGLRQRRRGGRAVERRGAELLDGAPGGADRSPKTAHRPLRGRDGRWGPRGGGVRWTGGDGRRRPRRLPGRPGRSHG